MVNSVINKYFFIYNCMYLVKIYIYFFVEFIIPSLFFFKNLNYVQRIKYIMIVEVYLSHIGLKTSWHNRRGDVLT